MKFAIVLLASVALVQAKSRAGWSPTTPGWSNPPLTTAGWTTLPPTTQGWTTLPPTTQGWTTLPPTTQGWTTLPPTTQGWTTLPPTTQGWSTPPPTTGWPAPPPPPGWGPSPIASNIAVNLAGELAAVGDGWSSENSATNVQVVGGWGVPAGLSISSGGESVVAQEGNILQATNVQGGVDANSVQLIGVGQVAEALNGLDVVASGLTALLGNSGASSSAGEGALASAGSSSIVASRS